MSETHILIIFEIEARAEITQPKNKDSGEIAEEFNKSAEKISDNSEREVRKLFPSYVRVQADVHFKPGSLVMVATVAVHSWLGNTGLDALKGVAEEQLSALVKMSVLRAMNRIRDIDPNLLSYVGPMEMTVSAVRDALPTQDRQEKTVPKSGAANWLGWAVVVVFLLQVLLILDRFVVVQLR